MINDGDEYGFPDDFDDNTDGADLIKARAALRQANQARTRTDSLVAQTHAELASLRTMHNENHFIEKMKLIIRGTP